MIKICHMTSVHPRYDGRIFRKECVSLFKAGYNVNLIVADGKGNEVTEGINIIDVGTETGRFNRILKNGRKIQNQAIELNCDVYHFHDPELIFAGLALKKKGKKVIFDMHENVPGDIEEKAYLPVLLRKVLSFLYKKLEIYTVKKIDGIVSTRESINERLKKYNPNIVLITNYPIVDKEIQKETNNTPTICFAGAVVPNWQHKEVIKAIEPIKSIKYHLAGTADKDYLKELLALQGWEKVNYEGKIPFSKVKSIYQKATIGVAVYIYCKNMDGNYGNLANTKLFEYMNWGLPIICTDFTLWKEIVENEVKCGICVNPYDVNAMTNAINYLIQNPDKAQEMGEKGRNAVLTKYNWEVLEKRLVDFYEKVTSKI